MPLHAEGARLVGHDRHDVLADLLVAHERREDPDERHRRRDLALAGAVELGLERRQLRHGQRLRRAPAAHGQAAAQRLAALAQVGHLRRVLGRAVEGLLGDLLVGELQPEAVPEGVERLVGHLLLLVGDVLALAGRAHPVALDRLGQDHGRAALGAHRLGVGRVDLRRVVAAAVEAPDVGVRPVLDALGQLGVGAEEVVAHVLAVARLEGLVLAVDALVHAALEEPVVVGLEQRVPLVAPDHLEHVPARAAEDGLELVDDLAVAAHGPVEALQVAVDDEHEVVEVLVAGERDRAQRLGLVGLAVAEERPHLAPARVGQPAARQVLHEPRLVDRHDRPEAHRDGRELPEVRHQPRVRVRAQPALGDLLAEAEQVLLAEPALEEGAGVDARRRVALDVDEVAAVLLARRVPEVVEADLVERRGRLVGGDVAAELGGLRVGAQHGGHRVPADDRADAGARSRDRPGTGPRARAGSC